MSSKLWKLPFIVQSKVPFKILPDSWYLKATFKGLMDQELDLKHPKTFNQKLQLLKLRQTGEDFTRWVDKESAKKKAADLVGKEAVIETIGVYERVEDIDFASLPERYVLKVTHNSGGVWIVDESHPMNPGRLKEVEKALASNFYYQWREAPYKRIHPKILIESWLGDNLEDYKFFCFNGQVKVILVCSDRAHELKEDFMDPQWNWLDLARAKHPRSQTAPARPKTLKAMTEMAQTLSAGYPFVRVDLFEKEDRVYFGEMTFYPACGFEGFVPAEWDEKMGEWIQWV